MYVLISLTRLSSMIIDYDNYYIGGARKITRCAKKKKRYLFLSKIYTIHDIRDVLKRQNTFTFKFSISLLSTSVYCSI